MIYGWTEILKITKSKETTYTELVRGSKKNNLERAGYLVRMWKRKIVWITRRKETTKKSKTLVGLNITMDLRESG
jgi:hypothetical protein